MRRERFLGIQDLMPRISPAVTEEALPEVHTWIREIRVYVSPTMTVLQWRP